MAQYHSHREREELKKKFMIIAVAFVGVCIVLGVILHAIDNAEIHSAEESTSAEDTVTIGGKEYTAKKGIKTVLVMGNDNSESRDQAGNGQADTIELLIINSRKKTYNRITINRNTMTDVNSLDQQGNVTATSVVQICLAYAQGKDEEAGAKNVADAVSNLIYGATIDEYASINMDAIATINHTLGGVTVTIEEDFSKTDPTLIMGETITLSDEQAEHYVHDRQKVADGTNENRIKRQNTYLAGAKVKLIEKCKEDSSYQCH